MHISAEKWSEGTSPPQPPPFLCLWDLRYLTLSFHSQKIVFHCTNNIPKYLQMHSNFLNSFFKKNLQYTHWVKHAFHPTNPVLYISDDILSQSQKKNSWQFHRRYMWVQSVTVKSHSQYIFLYFDCSCFPVRVAVQTLPRSFMFFLCMCEVFFWCFSCLL